MNVNVVISYIREKKVNDWQLKMLLRSIEKHFDNPSITILGDDPFHFLKSNVKFHVIPMKKDGHILSHSKAVLFAIDQIKDGYFIYNGSIFMKDMKKSNDFLLPVIDVHLTPSSIRKPIEESVMFTVKHLQILKRYNYVTFPFVPFLFNKEKIKAIFKKMPEVLTENHYIQPILANFLPLKKLKVYKSIKINCFNPHSFTCLSRQEIMKNKKCFFLNTNQAEDIAFQFKIESLFPHKSKWEL